LLGAQLAGLKVVPWADALASCLAELRAVTKAVVTERKKALSTADGLAENSVG
jgi:translation elongation factor EF-Ts